MKKQLKGFIVVAKLLKDSFIFAFASIAANKLRTSLSLLGITIGIFSIITVFTAVDALSSNIESGLASVGGDVVYIERFPWGGDNEYPWWKYRLRPAITYEEYSYLQKNSKYSEAICFTTSFGRELKYKSKQTSRVSVRAVTHAWETIGSFVVERGRYFTQQESASGTNVVVIGNKIAEDLFEDEDPIGKYMKMGDSKVRVVGVLKREGKSMVNFIDYDNTILLPYNFSKTVVSPRFGGTIAVKSKSGIPTDEIKEELRMLMRAKKRLTPAQDDDFALNELSVIQGQVDSINGVMSAVGTVIGGFSMLIGAFGIANIMFVSVKERTNLIGIQKALGAKRYFILSQFLYESVLLAVLGGIFGLILVYGATALASSLMDFELSLSAGNILIGIGMSAIVGLLAGFIPAYSASRLDPVVAISS